MRLSVSVFPPYLSSLCKSAAVPVVVVVVVPVSVDVLLARVLKEDLQLRGLDAGQGQVGGARILH